MTLIFLQSFFALLSVLVLTCAQEWEVGLNYSLRGKDLLPFGTVMIRKQFDGNYTGDFVPSRSKADILETLKNAATEVTETSYKMQTGKTFSLNSLKAFSHSNFGHLIELTIDQVSHRILSITHYPHHIKSPIGELHVDVRVNQIREIAGPETTAYLHRIEMEKRTRQHGATQDNRSFLQKYWMYFVPVVLFMVLSNAFNTENQAQE